MYVRSKVHLNSEVGVDSPNLKQIDISQTSISRILEWWRYLEHQRGPTLDMLTSKCLTICRDPNSKATKHYTNIDPDGRVESLLLEYSIHGLYCRIIYFKNKTNQSIKLFQLKAGHVTYETCPFFETITFSEKLKALVSAITQVGLKKRKRSHSEIRKWSHPSFDQHRDGIEDVKGWYANTERPHEKYESWK